MLRVSSLILMIITVASADSFSQNNSDAIISVWDTDKGLVEIYQNNDSFIGNPIDANGNKNKQVEILKLVYSDSEWKGKIYNKKKNKVFDSI